MELIILLILTAVIETPVIIIYSLIAHEYIHWGAMGICVLAGMIPIICIYKGWI